MTAQKKKKEKQADISTESPPAATTPFSIHGHFLTVTHHLISSYHYHLSHHHHHLSLSSSSCFPPFLSPFSSLVFVLVVYWYHVLILMLPSLSLSSSSVFLPGSESSSPGSESDCFCLVSWVVVLSCCR